jgi:mannose-1-phosphate guanylyltransferase
MPWFLRVSATTPVQTDSPTIDWTLALAGGDGSRLAEYVERRFGARIPKQYCCLLGRRSMLEHTLDRLATLTPPSRTLTVIGPDHANLAIPQLAGRCDHVFRQPCGRDTAVAVYVGLAMIMRWTPNAIVTLTPTDHYVAPERSYAAQVRRARGIAGQMRDRVVVIGAPPNEPDPELGYLTLGATALPGARRVAGFVEKPSVVNAAALIRIGALWNTMVMCGTVGAFWELGRASDPELVDLLEAFVPLVGTPDEADALEHVYRTCRPASFSRDIAERSPEHLVAMSLDGVEWSDWGRPERVETVLALRRSRVDVAQASAV